MPSRRIRSSVRQSLLKLNTEVQREVNTELFAAGRDIQRAYRKYTGNWQHKPTFSVSTVITPKLVSVEIVPQRNTKAGKIFQWVDKGTGKHRPGGAPYTIAPKAPNTVLTFRGGYSPKTAGGGGSRQLAYGGLGRATGGWARKKSVVHPGIKARKFSEVAVDSLKPPFGNRIENALRRAVRRASR